MHVENGVLTREFRLAEILALVLAAYAAVRDAAGHEAACLPARGVGHAVGNADLAQNVAGSALCAPKAIVASDSGKWRSLGCSQFPFAKQVTSRAPACIVATIVLRRSRKRLVVKLRQGCKL